MRANHSAELSFGDELVEAVAKRCTESESGARAVDNILTHSMLPAISAEILARMARQEAFTRVEVSVDESGDFEFKVS